MGVDVWQAQTLMLHVTFLQTSVVKSVKEIAAAVCLVCSVWSGGGCVCCYGSVDTTSVQYKAFVKLCGGVPVTNTQLRPVKWITLQVICEGAKHRVPPSIDKGMSATAFSEKPV